jgi:RNA polymerase-associated protein RTF1
MSLDEKAQILAMPEIQRESILAERAEEQSRIVQNRQLRLRLAQARARPTTQKRKASDTGDDERRKTTRQRKTLGGRKEGEVNEKLEEYRRQRAQKDARKEQRKRDEEDRRANPNYDEDDAEEADMVESDLDADGESDNGYEPAPAEERNAKQREIEKIDDSPASLQDYNHVKVGRSNFAEVCYHPGFEEAIKDCYARISVGMDKSTGENIYRMGKITGFTEGRAYGMLGTNAKPITTTQYAMVAHGKSVREWPFIACSDSRITEVRILVFPVYRAFLI